MIYSAETHVPGTPAGGFSVSGVGKGTLLVESSALSGKASKSSVSDWLDIVVKYTEFEAPMLKASQCISACLEICLSRWHRYRDKDLHCVLYKPSRIQKQGIRVVICLVWSTDRWFKGQTSRRLLPHLPFAASSRHDTSRRVFGFPSHDHMIIPSAAVPRAIWLHASRIAQTHIQVFYFAVIAPRSLSEKCLATCITTP